MIGVADYSRFATELGCPVYCFAFENTTSKPAAFRRWGVLEESADSIQFLSGRENGNFYYTGLAGQEPDCSMAAPECYFSRNSLMLSTD